MGTKLNLSDPPPWEEIKHAHGRSRLERAYPTLGELAMATDAELLKIGGVGRKTLKVVRRMVDEYVDYSQMSDFFRNRFSELRSEAARLEVENKRLKSIADERSARGFQQETARTKEKNKTLLWRLAEARRHIAILSKHAEGVPKEQAIEIEQWLEGGYREEHVRKERQVEEAAAREAGLRDKLQAIRDILNE